MSIPRADSTIKGVELQLGGFLCNQHLRGKMSYPPLGAYFKSQLVTTLPYPTKSFAGKTVIVTGSTAGLGLEAARHLVRLNATQVILAIRNVEKGRTVAADIERSTNKTGVIKVWELDHASYDSVKSFSKRCDGLERLDVVIANAGTHPRGPFAMAEDNETTVTVNFVTTMLLGLSLLPKLRKTATDFDTDVVLTFVGSFVFWMAKFPQSKADKILAELADESSYDLEDRLAFRRFLTETTLTCGKSGIMPQRQCCCLRIVSWLRS